MSIFESQNKTFDGGWTPVLISFAVLVACFVLLGYVIYGDF